MVLGRAHLQRCPVMQAGSPGGRSAGPDTGLHQSPRINPGKSPALFKPCRHPRLTVSYKTAFLGLPHGRKPDPLLSLPGPHLSALPGRGPLLGYPVAEALRIPQAGTLAHQLLPCSQMVKKLVGGFLRLEIKFKYYVEITKQIKSC